MRKYEFETGYNNLKKTKTLKIFQFDIIWEEHSKFRHCGLGVATWAFVPDRPELNSNPVIY